MGAIDLLQIYRCDQLLVALLASGLLYFPLPVTQFSLLAGTCVPPWCSSCWGGWFSTSRCSLNTAKFPSRWASLCNKLFQHVPAPPQTIHLWIKCSIRMTSPVSDLVLALTPCSCWSTTTSKTGSTTVCRLEWAASAWPQRRSSSSRRSSSGEFLTPFLTRYEQRAWRAEDDTSYCGCMHGDQRFSAVLRPRRSFSIENSPIANYHQVKYYIMIV